MHKPLNLAWRCALVTVAILWLGHTFERAIISSVLPVLRATLEYVQDDFKVLELDIASAGANETLRLRADYAHPFYVGGHLMRPLNAASNTANSSVGWLQVDLTSGGLLQYCLLMLIVLLSWPTTGMRESISRGLLAIPLLTSLLLINGVSTLLAELWNTAYQTDAPDEFLLSLAWSKFLMGGGGAMLALALAAVVIAAGSRIGFARIGFGRRASADISQSHIVAKVT